MKTEMNLEMVPIDILVHPEYNPRFMPSEEMQKLIDEINEFGMVENIVVNKRNMHIVGGNQRKMAMELSGATEAPVYFVDLDDSQERRLNLALNKIGGKWDDVKLAEVLKSLNGDVINTGFSDEEIKSFLDTGTISDISAPSGSIQLDEFIEIYFGEFRGPVPKAIYENFKLEIDRLKKHLYPKDNSKDVGFVSPLEFLIAQSATSSLP